jgi:endonuclease-3
MGAFARQLDVLESFHGRQRPDWPVDPYEFLVWWHCGYPPSDEACSKGWAALNAEGLDLSPPKLANVRESVLIRVLKAGGLIPELRAQRIKTVANRVIGEWGGDMARGLRAMPVAAAIKTLKKLPGIGEPGAERILLFGDIAPLPAVPSNATQVAVRMQRGASLDAYAKDYREGRRLIEGEVPATAAARQRAFLLLKVHGQTLCKRSTPKCDACPIAPTCAYFARLRSSAKRKTAARKKAPARS